MSNRCFILGAGFSKCCGLPLANELTELVLKTRWRKNELDQSPQPELLQPGDFGYDSITERDLRVIRLLFPAQCGDGNWPDFEQLYTALDEAALFQDAFERVTGSRGRSWAKERRDRFLKDLEIALAERTSTSPHEGQAAISRFVRSLIPTHDHVISFNWDVLVEIAAARQEIPVHYQGPLTAQGLGMTKPHGSLNLVEIPQTEYDDVKSSVTVYGLDIEGEYELHGVPQVLLRAHDPGKTGSRTVHVFKRTRLVEPSTHKQYDSPWLDRQWTRAIEMVGTAESIVVIGFSFPNTDIRPRLLLQLAVLNRPTLRVQIVDPNALNLVNRLGKETGCHAEAISARWEDWL
jgi:hypothetical protein